MEDVLKMFLNLNSKVLIYVPFWGQDLFSFLLFEKLLLKGG